MNPIKTILVPVDFGEPSEAALAYAVDLAEAMHARIFLLNTYELPIIGFPDGALVASAEWATKIIAASEKALSDMVAKIGKRNVEVTTLLRQGDARLVIPEIVDEVQAQLIVMGTHGRKGVARALIGSVAERVVRTAKVPVLTVHAVPEMK